MLESLLFMLEATGEQIRQYYIEVPEEIYNEILKADPTSIIKGKEIKKVGKYSKHCLQLWLKTKYNVKLLKPALKMWEDNKKNIKKVFNTVKSLEEIQEISNEVESHFSLEAKAKKDSKVVIKSGSNILRQIFSKEAAIFYGNFCGMKNKPKPNQSNWCTAYKAGTYYDTNYNKSKGDLYIWSNKDKLLGQFFYSKDNTYKESHDNNNGTLNFKTVPNEFKNFLSKKYKIIPIKNNMKYKNKKYKSIVVDIFGNFITGYDAETSEILEDDMTVLLDEDISLNSLNKKTVKLLKKMITLDASIFKENKVNLINLFLNGVIGILSYDIGEYKSICTWFEFNSENKNIIPEIKHRSSAAKKIIDTILKNGLEIIN